MSLSTAGTSTCQTPPGTSPMLEFSLVHSRTGSCFVEEVVLGVSEHEGQAWDALMYFQTGVLFLRLCEEKFVDHLEKLWCVFLQL